MATVTKTSTKLPRTRRPPLEGLRRHLETFIGGQLRNPLFILQVALTLILVGATMVAMAGWIFGASDQRLRIPLLLIGLAIITLSVSINRGAFGASVAILIVGILVAPRDYLLRIAHMFSRPDAPFEQYARKYEGEGDPADSTAVIQQVLSTLETRGLLKITPAVSKAVNRVITQQEIDRIGEIVRRENATYPLRQVVEGGAALRRLIEDHGQNTYLHEDLDLLREHGLVEFSGTDYSAVRPTELGRRMAPMIGSRFGDVEASTLRFIDFDADRPLPQEMEEARLTSTIRSTLPRGEAVKWYRFAVTRPGNYQIDVTSEQGDPKIALFGPNGFSQIAIDDDGGGGLNSRVRRNLQSGTYYLGIGNLRGNEADFELKIDNPPT